MGHGSSTSIRISTSAASSGSKFFLILFAIAAAGLIPRFALGRSQFIGFDGWWHVFIATQDRWLMLAGEWKGDAHPPLFYLLLRLAAACSHSPLMLRAIGIVCGVASCVIFGVAARKICRYRASALIAAAAWTFAWNIIEIDTDVRAYPLALLFILLAFNSLLDWAADPGGPAAGTAIVWFGFWSLLAMLSEYYTVFFIAACLGTLLLRAAMQPGSRAALLHSLRIHRKPWLFALTSTLIVFMGFFAFHMIVHPQDQPYLAPFVWHNDPAIDLDTFLLSNLENEAAFFTPFNLAPAAALSVVLVLFVLTRKQRARSEVSRYPPLILTCLLAQLMALSLAGRYPFGGEFRHQSIVAPFVFLTAALLLDRVAGVLKPPLVRTAAFCAAGLLVACSFVRGWTTWPWNSEPLLNAEYQLFQTLFPHPSAIYGDTTSSIFFYSRNHDSPWIFQDRFMADDQRITVYKVETDHPLRFLRNKRETNFDLANPEVYRTLAIALRTEGIRSIVLYYVGLKWDASGAAILEDKLRTLPSQAGLEIGRVFVGRTYVFAEFSLRD